MDWRFHEGRCPVSLVCQSLSSTEHCKYLLSDKLPKYSHPHEKTSQRHFTSPCLILMNGWILLQRVNGVGEGMEGPGMDRCRDNLPPKCKKHKPWRWQLALTCEVRSASFLVHATCFPFFILFSLLSAWEEGIRFWWYAEEDIAYAFVGMARTLYIMITLNFRGNTLRLPRSECNDFVALSFTFDSELKAPWGQRICSVPLLNTSCPVPGTMCVWTRVGAQ